MKEQTESRTNQKLRRKPSWPKILTRHLPSGNTQWRIDVVVDGARVYESFKTEADAISRAWLDRTANLDAELSCIPESRS